MLLVSIISFSIDRRRIKPVIFMLYGKDYEICSKYFCCDLCVIIFKLAKSTVEKYAHSNGLFDLQKTFFLFSVWHFRVPKFTY